MMWGGLVTDLLAKVTGYFQNIPKHYLFKKEYTDEELQRIDEEKARRHQESEPAKVESEQPKAERIGGVGAANVI